MQIEIQTSHCDRSYLYENLFEGMLPRSPHFEFGFHSEEIMWSNVRIIFSYRNIARI